MAGDWIKMGKDLLTHPKVVRMSSALRADRLRTVGGLFAVWCLFDTHSADGQLSGYTPEALDELVGFPGISAAMEAVGWLSHDDEGVFLPRFEEHNGQSAKRRAQETDRKREGRKTSASDADKKRTREEKRREEVLVKEIPRVEAARPVVEQPPHAADDDLGQQANGVPACPHLDVLALWQEVLPAMPQHNPELWRGARADHLRARWRETAVIKRWSSKDDGLAYLRKLFAYIGQSPFLTGRVPPRETGRPPFVIELEWLVSPTNWAKVIEGKYHQQTEPEEATT